MKFSPGTILLFLLMFAYATSQLAQAEPLTLSVSSEQELNIERYPGSGDFLFIWIAASHGFHQRHLQVASSLAALGHEVWQVDLLDSLFMPHTAVSIRTLDGNLVAHLIQTAHHRTGKKIVLLSSAYGAIPTLRGVQQWQRSKPAKNRLAGVILFSPDLYQRIPSLGLQPEFVSVAGQTRIPIHIFQSQKHSNRWQLPRLLEKLQQGGSATKVTLMQGVTSLFYHEDVAPSTLDRLPGIGKEIVSAAQLFRHYPRLASLNANPTFDTGKPPVPAGESVSGIDIALKEFRGHPLPPSLFLPNSKTGERSHVEFSGKVTLVNFWATWCPPCVREIPSLNALAKHMQGSKFQLISVNYGQSPEQVSEFLRRVKVDFPVLLDRDGSVSADWKVIAFPSTFVIDKQGKVRYGVNAAIHWDSPDIYQLLEKLVTE